jgi:hypothetical protein
MADTVTPVIPGNNEGGGGPPPNPGDSATTTVVAPQPGPMGAKPPPAPEAPDPKAATPPVAPKAPAPAQTTSPKDPPAAKTVAEAPDPAKATEPPKEGDQPADWRKELAGEDAKLLKRLQRFNSVKDVLNSYLAMEQQRSSGELRKALPTHHTDEELAAYRKENGIPEEPAGYDTNLGGGHVWGEADKPLLADFTRMAHEANMPPDMLKMALGWYEDRRIAQANEQFEADEMARARAQEALMAEWKHEYKANANAARNYFEGADKIWDRIMGARDAQGNKLGNVPEIMGFFSSKARENNPYATLVVGDGAAQVQAADKEFEQLTALQREGAQSGNAYYHGPNRDKFQARWRELFEAREKMAELQKGRAA